MNWIPLEHLLLEQGPNRQVTFAPALDRQQLRGQALALAAGLQARGVKRVAIYLEDAGELAIALLGAWRAGASVLLPADLQPQTRQRWAADVDLWITDAEAPLAELYADPLPGTALDLDLTRLSLCTSGSSGAPKRIDKTLRQLANEVQALETLWSADLGDACMIGSVATQHIYGLLFRVLWPLCAGRPFLRRQLPFTEDLQRHSREHGEFAWVTSPALLKRMGDNLDWAAMSAVKRVFSSGGALPEQAASQLAERIGQRPTEILGSSETGGIAWRQRDSLWQAFADIRLSQNTEGALCIESPYLPAGHVEHTADAAEFANDGRFTLLGRLDRIVKLEEKRVSLPMLEQALLEHPWVQDVRLGVVRGARASLGALLALSDEGLAALQTGGRRALTEQLRQHLSGHCEALALPRRWRLLRQLPFNSQGKLPQAQVESLLQAPRPKVPEIVSQGQEGDEWHLQLTVPVDLAFFSGHFPTAPVLPGVVQVDWALALGQQALPLPPRFAGMEVLKFQQLVRPGEPLALTLRFDAERGKLHFAYRHNGKPCSSGRILLEPDHA